jgi:hypothetical protein
LLRGTYREHPEKPQQFNNTHFKENQMKKIAITALLTLNAATAFSQTTARWTGAFSPTILYVSSIDNYQMRMYGPITSICPAGFAYVNQSDPASKTYFSAMMLAYANGKQVNLFTANPDAIGACRILEIQVIN